MAELAALRRAPVVSAFAELRLLPPATRFVLRGDAGAVRAAGAAIGIDIEQAPCRASQQGTRAALWLGPDEYLLLGAEAEARALAGVLAQALQGVPHALVDVSHRQTALEMLGPRAVEILSSGCPLDLDLMAFPVGMCTRTVFAKAEIVLWRSAPDALRIEVWRSFTDYVARLLGEAAREY
ncbi:MAG TPA: sarcosine oxidase subunit gamma family protein [Steroidobacteraceae bacterium]|jgi:sarcosine oxidase subunit gamma|nr:sarcosine oxidase subunit gamma family protein [Steroidobacteraceae bacterium]